MDRLPRFYIQPNTRYVKKVIIDDDQVLHIRKSLRLEVGDPIIVFDGLQEKFLCELILITKKKVEARIIKNLELNIPHPEITLIQSIPKSRKLDTIIKCLTEIGISKIIPIETDFSIVKAKDIVKKYSRFYKIIIESCKQSERDILLELEQPQIFNYIKNLQNYDLKIIASAKGNAENLKAILNKSKNPLKIVYIIGPEGDFSQRELEIARESDFQHAIISENILRTETAAIYLGSILSFYFS